MPEPLLTVSNVTYSTGGVTLIESLDLVGRRGEVVAILGPNGAGKSTLMRLIAGDVVPDTGRITISGVDTESATPGDLARIRSVMRQGGASDIPFSALAVVEMGRYPHRADAEASSEMDREAVRSAMARTDTSHLAGRTFATLSGGEQTMVNMARVLAQGAPLVLLDEPTTALDVAHAQRVLVEIGQLAREDASVVAVLHDLNAAAFHADRVLLMADGAIRAEGTPDDVLRADLLSDVYGQAMTVVEHPTRGCPLVLVTESQR